jgi:hypothetical protein
MSLMFTARIRRSTRHWSSENSTDAAQDGIKNSGISQSLTAVLRS